MVLNVLICGGGNGAHAMCGLAGLRPDVVVRVLSLYSDEAERWCRISESRQLKLSGKGIEGTVQYSPKPECVTNDPSLVVPQSDIVLLIVPAFAHDQYLSALKPYIRVGVVIVGLPSSNGFEFCASGILKERSESCTLVACDSLPWACRLVSFGEHVEILGSKESLLCAIRPGNVDPLVAPISTLQMLIGQKPVLTSAGHLLGITLLSSNAFVHPGILFSKWNDSQWDGKPVSEVPLFYQGLNQYGADILSSASNEVVQIARKIMELRPGIDLNLVVPLHDIHVSWYGDQIKDKSSLLTCFTTNPAYNGLKHPCVSTENGHLPDFNFRYLTEDIPYGLIAIKGVAEIVGIDTPTIDEIIEWAQVKLGKVYLVDKKLIGADIVNSRAPARYGITTLEQLLHVE